jgi:hypothetical protein
MAVRIGLGRPALAWPALLLYARRKVWERLEPMAEQRIETSIEIDAPPERVWSLLTDFAGMAAWNPFIKSISGELMPGSRLSVHIAPPGKAGMRFKPTIVTVRPGRELRWLGRLLLPGIFDGEHYFRLEPVGNRVRFIHGERFSGVLVGFMRGMLASTEDGFRAMNAALKERAESQEPHR